MKSRVPKIGRFMMLGGADQRTLLGAVASLPAIWVGLRLMGLPRLHALLQLPTKADSRQIPLEDMQALGALVDIASRHTIGPATCLTRSLLLIWLLRRRGVRSQLRIGVRVEGGMAAHAWVEFEDVPVNDQADIRLQFLPFEERLPLSAFKTR